MLNLRYILRLISAFLKRFGSLILVGVLIGLVIFILFRYAIPRLFYSTQRIGYIGRYESDNLPGFVTKLIGNGLTNIDAGGNVVANLASRWEVADNGTTWTFYLDQNKYWHDGKQVLASDLTFNFSDVEITYPNNNTINFKLKEPFSAFGSVVSKPIFRRGLLGTGEYKVDKIRLNSSLVQEIVLVNNERQKKIVRFYPTEEAAKTAFKMGKIDQILELFDPKPFSEWKTARVEKTTDLEKIVLLFFNTQDDKLADKSLRQVLTYLIDKDKYGERATTPITPFSWAYNPVVKRYDQSTQRAQELFDALPKELTNDLTISLITTPALLSVAEDIIKTWQDFGIKSNVQVASGIPENHQAYLAIFEPPKDPDQYALWHSTQTGSNISRYTSPRIDKLLEDGRKELNQDERKKIYLDLQRFLVEDTPAAFLYHPTFYNIIRK